MDTKAVATSTENLIEEEGIFADVVDVDGFDRNNITKQTKGSINLGEPITIPSKYGRDEETDSVCSILRSMY